VRTFAAANDETMKTALSYARWSRDAIAAAFQTNDRLPIGVGVR